MSQAIELINNLVARPFYVRTPTCLRTSLQSIRAQKVNPFYVRNEWLYNTKSSMLNGCVRNEYFF